MKKVMLLAVFCLLFIVSPSFAQNKPSPHDALPPLIYVDSVKISRQQLDFIKPDEIGSFRIDKKANTIFITLKDHSQLQSLLQDLKPLSLNDIILKNIAKADSKKPVLYVLNNKLITDTAGVRITFNQLEPVKVLKASETSYFKTTLPNALIVYINTKPAPVFIRGQVVGK